MFEISCNVRKKEKVCGSRKYIFFVRSNLKLMSA